MAKPNTTWLYNETSNDGANTGNASGGAGGAGSNWIVVDLSNDKLTFLDSQQQDGDALTDPKYPAIIPGAGNLEVPKTFVEDASLGGAGEYNQAPLAGSDQGGQSGGNTRYVFAIYFDGATATVPYLEAWDNTLHLTGNDSFLGSGTPANSTLRAVTTTNAVPGATNWGGTPIATQSDRISLDTGALGGAKNLYFNIRQVIPFSFSVHATTSLVLTLRYTYT